VWPLASEDLALQRETKAKAKGKERPVKGVVNVHAWTLMSHWQSLN